MSESGSGLPPAGWYPDPTGAVAGQKRWWDGGQWTSHVQAPPVPEPAVVPAAPVYAAPQAPVYQPMASYVEDPAAGSRSGSVRTIPSHATTLPGILLSITPFPQTVIFLIFQSIASVTSIDVINLVGLGIALLINILWAIQDHYALRSIGYQRPGHWAWIFLGPFWYLVFRMVRTRAEAATGTSYIVRYLVSFALASIIGVVLSVYFAPLAGNSLSTTRPDYSIDVAIAVEEDARAVLGKSYDVTCPGPVPDIGEHRELACSVEETATGRVGTTTVTMEEKGTNSYTFEYTEFVFDE